jgi:general secretion pathway protein I
VRRRLCSTASSGFSLLEVLFAVALFGAVVTFILSAQAGLIAGNRTASNMSQATELARCRMTEIEEKQLKLGFPEIEEKDSTTSCCEEKETPGFTCEWSVERVKLPEVTTLGGDAGLTSLLGGSLGLSGASGALSAMPGAGLPPAAGQLLSNPISATLDLDAGLKTMGTALDQSFGGAGAQGLLSMAFSIVYPSLKPLLEAAIRRVTVVVRWKEGINERNLAVTQYITNPSRAGLLASMADAGAFSADGGLPFGAGTTSGGTANPLNPLGGAPVH